MKPNTEGHWAMAGDRFRCEQSQRKRTWSMTQLCHAWPAGAGAEGGSWSGGGSGRQGAEGDGAAAGTVAVAGCLRKTLHCINE